MPLDIRFRCACPSDAADLTRIAQRSKAHWGYSREFMTAAGRELTVTREAILERNLYFTVALDHQQIIGFYALDDSANPEIELEAMFVDPPCIGQGVGRQMMLHAQARARQLGARVMLIQSDPNAQKFYLAAGAEVCGQRESGSIPGRMLPLLRIELNATGEQAINA